MSLFESNSELTGVSNTSESLSESYSELTAFSYTAKSLYESYSELTGVSNTAAIVSNELCLIQTQTSGLHESG